MRLLKQSMGLAVLTIGLLVGCDDGPTELEPGSAAVCGGYSDWRSSPFVLPYPPGTSYVVMTGNCDPAHSGANRYGFDFAMPIGTPITAAMGGEVVEVIDRWPDSSRDGAENNGVVILQDDGRFGNYWHLQQEGALVDVGQRVQRGDVIARSGASGTGPEHLHFHVSSCHPGCGSEPITFSNTDPNPQGPTSGTAWPAYPYD